MSDLALLHKIEKKLRFNLKEISLEEFIMTDHNNKIDRCYVLSNDKRLIALNLNEVSVNKLLKIDFSRFRYIKYLQFNNCNLNDLSLLKGFTSLTRLWLQNNQITDLSPLKEIKGLKRLWLQNNQITNISPLKELTNLSSIYLSDNKISDISPLKELKSLEGLYLYKNQIKDIFPLADLNSLLFLWLEKNQIIDLSPLKELNNLIWLSLDSNEISNIYPLKGLKRLASLYLDSNQIRDITPIKELTNLNRLDLMENPIEELPIWITDFNMEIQWNSDFGKDGFISFFNNPIKAPPVDIVKQGKEAVKVYFDSIDGEVSLYETKLVIVGRGYAGKTVLAKKLLNIDFKLPKKEDTTKGVVIIKEPLFHFIKDYNVDFKYHLWDFGGQEKYDATHQFFITENSLYIFVTEARQESNYLDFDFWLNTIELFAIDAPVIVVMSKIDDRKKDLPQSTFKDRYKNIYDFAKVSCADGREDTILSLKNIIGEATTEKLKLIKFPSKKWKNVPDKLEQLAKEKDYISFREFLDICRGFGLDELKASVLSKYLHNLGIIIYRKDDLLLSKMVIINIDWCVDAAYKVLDNAKVSEQRGYFSDTDLKEIWSDKKYQNKQQELLNLMKKYKLCFELRDKTGYIAPNLLPEDKPLELLWDNTDNLLFEYRYKFMPAGLLTRFIVESHAFIKDESYWKYGVEIEYEETTALIVEEYIDRKISISIKGKNKKGLLNTIRMFFAEVHKDITALKPIEMVPCNCKECKNSSKPYFYDYLTLNKFLEKGEDLIPCNNSIEKVKIQTLIDDILPKPSQIIIKDDDLQEFIYKLLSNVENNLNCREGYSYLWRDKQCHKDPKSETEIQPYICNLLEVGAESSGIQLSREVKEGNGNIDVHFSYTNRENKIARTGIEIKKADHADVETAVGTQLTAYLDSMKTKHGIYLVMWFKNKQYDNPKYGSIEELEKAIKLNIPIEYSIKVKIINCNKPISPSKIK